MPEKALLLHSEHTKFPYLLGNLVLVAPLDVWSTDITYIRLPNGYAYLVAVYKKTLLQ